MGFCTAFVLLSAVVVATLATAFARWAITSGALGAVAQFGATLTPFNASFTSAFTAGFATATAFTRGTDFTIGTFAAFATATIATATAAITATFTTIAIAFVATLAVAAGAGLLVFFAIGRWCRFGAATEQVLQPAKEPAFCGRSGHGGFCRLALGFGCGHGGFRFGHGHRGRRIRQHALDDRRLLVGGLLRPACHGGRVFNLFGHLVAGFDAVQTRIVVLQTLEFVVRCLEGFVGHQQHIDALLQLNFGDLRALLVQQERRHFDRHLGVDGGAVVLHGLFLNDAQNLQCRALGVADVACATASRARNRGPFGECGLQALAAHFEQAELADRAKLDAGAVLAQRIAQAVFHFAAVLRLFHVNEVDHDQAAQITQTHLAGHFVGSFQVGAGGGFFDIATLDGAGRVHVHRNQSFGVVDHNGAARRQLHRAGISRLDLMLDLEAAEQRGVIAVTLNTGSEFRHDMAHELLSLVVNVIGVDQDVADVVVEIVANGANHQARFLVNQERAFTALRGAIDGGPQLEQVVQIPLQFGSRAANTRCAGNDGHAFGVFQLVHRLFELSPVVTLDTAADATPTRVVGHEHHVATSQADERGQRRAFVAALFFFDLHQERLTLFDHVLNARLADGHAFSKVLAGDFFEGQEAVTVFAVVNKAGFERRLDTGHHRLVDVALALFATFNFDFVVEEFLSVDDGQAALFSLRGVDQHPFHDAFLLLSAWAPEQ